MGWKDWPYWLKGGLISLIFLVFFPITIIASCIIGGILGFINSCENQGSKLYLNVIIYSIILFGIGAFIGWIIGKIKNRK